MKSKRIHDNDPLYNLLLPYVNRSFRRSYRKVEYRDVDAVPKEGAVIFAPNHANTLMDALAVLSLDNHAKVFVARADIFKNRVAASILRFLKILPINRIRDGVEALSENEGIMRECIDALCDGVPFCILPEGRHRPMHSLLPLKKGIARIAFGAFDEIRDREPVYIVPVGLEYEDYFEFRSHLLVNIGRPICLQDFVAEHGTLSRAELYRNLLVDLDARMRETIICLPDDERYEGTWEAANILTGREVAAGDDLLERKRGIQEAAEKVVHQHPELIERGRRQARRRKALGIGLGSVVRKRAGWEMVTRGLLLLLFALPVLFLTLLTGPGLLLVAFIKKRLKDKAFLNSIRYVSCFLLNPLLLIILAIPALFFIPWWACLGAVVLSWYSPIAVYDWSNGIRHLISDIRYRYHKKALA